MRNGNCGKGNWDESVELKWLMEVMVEKRLKEDEYYGLGEIAVSLRTALLCRKALSSMKSGDCRGFL
jgi:hypothetical protein